ncbi:hypothetical protein HanPI659440_Chr14g0526501 [Helianthus annuus]|nr:hypothetical protein HanPI659440_Chr14g0526501 [Helianthus annuus]
MVEIVDDYSEELGVCVTPLVKLDGYKTVHHETRNIVTCKFVFDVCVSLFSSLISFIILSKIL